MAKSRLFLLYHLEMSSEDEKKVASTDDQKQFLEILNSDQLYMSNLETLSWSAKNLKNYFKLDPKNIELYISKAKLFSDKENLSIDERLSALAPLLELGEMTSQTQQLMQAKANWANLSAKGEYERQSAMSTAIYLLQKSKQLDLARNMALAELKKSHSPFYFMSDLASIEKEAGKIDLALDWYKKAWSTSVGDNTRFQWGTSYILALIELAPDQSEKIENATKELFSEVVSKDDAFKGRNLKRFEKLSKNLKEWSKDKKHSENFLKFKNWVVAEIKKLPDGDKKKTAIKWSTSF